MTSNKILNTLDIYEDNSDIDDNIDIDIVNNDENDDSLTDTPENIRQINGSKHSLNNKWIMWYHHSRNNWKIDGYKKIFIINTIKDFWDLHNNIEKIGGINNMHFFLMRENVEPIWEHPGNKTGGCWSFKIPSEQAFDLWQKLGVYMIGETMSSLPLLINGISICLKNPATSVIKIWNNNSKYNSINLLPHNIIDEYGYNIIYKAHIPEY